MSPHKRMPANESEKVCCPDSVDVSHARNEIVVQLYRYVHD